MAITTSIAPISATTTTTTSTFASTITTTTTAAQTQTIHASAINAGVPAGLSQMADSEIIFPNMSLEEAVALIKNFIEDSELKKLTISFKDDKGWENIRAFLSDKNLESLPKPLGKEIILEADCSPCYEYFLRYTDVINSIGSSHVLNGVDLKGDVVVNTWRLLKPAIEKNSNIKKLQISDATSDAVCELFKIWMEYRHIPSPRANPGLKITTLSFANMKISDPAVFGSVLRNMVEKMPNLSTVDFSQTPLTAEAKEALSFQLEPLGRKDLLKF